MLKLGKNRVQCDVAMMYLAECITTLKNLPHTSISAVLISRAKNRLFVLRHSLMPVVKSFKRSAIVDFPQKACRFTNVVVSTVAKDIEYKENHSLYYHNFPLTSHPNIMSESNIWSKLKYAADLVSYQRYKDGFIELKKCRYVCSYQLAFCQAKLSLSDQTMQLPASFMITSSNIHDKIVYYWNTACKLTWYQDHKVTFYYGKYLSHKNKLKD